MRTFVIGDIHGAYKALIQVIERSGFDLDNDRLICLGDVADGWPEVAECLDYLIDNVKNLEYVRGNHDQWLKEWLEFGKSPIIWTLQGGQNSINSYLKHQDYPQIAKKHLAFLKNTKFYYLDDKNRLFVHGGIDLDKPLAENTKRYMSWDRDLWDRRNDDDFISKAKEQYKEVYVGHTSIYRFSHNPIRYGNIWFLDTGGGWEGVISMMDIDTKEFFQSDSVKELYPQGAGRI